MKFLKTSLPLLLGLLLALGATGCQSLFSGGDPAETADEGYYEEDVYDDTTLALDAEYGGYDTADEAPGFGDPTFAEMFGEAEDALDEVAEDPTVQAAENDPLAAVHFVRVIWGQLEANPELEEATDWHGTISIDRGYLVVMRQIKFEHATDWIVRPRPSPLVVELYSTTRPHFDGLVLKIIDNEPDSDQPNDLRIQLGPADFSVPVADLVDYEHLETVDALGNELLVQSLACTPTPNGWLAGIWVERHQHRGIFRGAFMNRVGQLEGFLRGHWGVDQGGLRLLFGKYIDREGLFRGILVGTWDPHPVSGAANAPASGTMEGLWYGRDGEATGEFGGTYRKGFRRGGFFCGHWEAYP
ncbi:MAG: hypothetical protein JW819_02685 [Candidatus Krumholzibacteriota bacterium]|nr:hypothetical protein [Candidatus Krumholzibacteriota bacterium]